MVAAKWMGLAVVEVELALASIVFIDVANGRSEAAAGETAIGRDGPERPVRVKPSTPYIYILYYVHMPPGGMYARPVRHGVLLAYTRKATIIHTRGSMLACSSLSIG